MGNRASLSSSSSLSSSYNQTGETIFDPMSDVSSGNSPEVGGRVRRRPRRSQQQLQQNNNTNGPCFLLRYLHASTVAVVAAAAAATDGNDSNNRSDGITNDNNNDDVEVVVELERLLRQLGLFEDFVQTLQHTSDSQETFQAFLEDFRTYYLLAEEMSEINADGDNTHRNNNTIITTLGKDITPPASLEAIDNLQKRNITKEDEKGGEPCNICCEHYVSRDNYDEGKSGMNSGCSCGEDIYMCHPCNTITQLPCGHVFHSSCIESWLHRKCTCPVCRYELPTDDPLFEKGRKERMKLRFIAC